MFSERGITDLTDTHAFHLRQQMLPDCRRMVTMRYRGLERYDLLPTEGCRVI